MEQPEVVRLEERIQLILTHVSRQNVVPDYNNTISCLVFIGLLSRSFVEQPEVVRLVERRLKPDYNNTISYLLFIGLLSRSSTLWSIRRL